MRYYLFLLLTLPIFGQNLHTNKPDLVYPILEEFIAENFKNSTPTFERINKIDSIIVMDLGYEVTGDFIRKITGLRERRGSIHTIKIDISLVENKRRFERTLKHELGHVFDLPHLDKEHFLDFMSEEHWQYIMYYYRDPEVWKRINYNYYKSLMK